MEPAPPQHIAIIMDGNGRWAQLRSLPRLEGHREGAKTVREVVRHCRELGVRALTLYAFSEQNWQRPRSEVMGLMRLLRDFVQGEWHEILDNDIRLSALGHTERLPLFVRGPLQSLMRASASNQGMTLSLALSYGGREEIVDTARHLAREVAAGRLRPEDIDESAFAATLSTRGLPEPELVIRTSGELRLSNFLLWESAYAEFYFTDTLWPEFTTRDLDHAIDEFHGRQRRFGRVESLPVRPAAGEASAELAASADDKPPTKQVQAC